MLNYLALDAATKTGYAHTDGTSGTYEAMGKARNCKFAEFAFWLNCFLDEHHTDALVHEQSHHRGGPATRLLLGLTSIVELIAAQRDLPVHAVHTATLKKYATGSGRAQKYQMREAAEAMHPTIALIDDNHIDALWLLQWAHEELS